MKFLFHIGRYIKLVRMAFSRPEKSSVYFKRIFEELEILGVNSIGIVIIISFFLGAVITIQTAYNIENPFVPLYLIGLGTRDSMMLEFSSTLVGLILAGKVGSNIASEIGTMRVSEQIDALEIMGINSASYLILPKIIASILFNPILCFLSMIVGILGGYIAGVATDVVSSEQYIYGIQYAFIPYYIFYAQVKTVVFAFIITTVSAYQGYYVSGGALEVGRASTKAVVFSNILILFFNLLLTQMMLT